MGYGAAGDEFRRVSIGHFKSRQQRDACLVAPPVDPAVPGEPAGRTVIDAVAGRVVGIEKMLGELRGRLQVFERRYGSYSGLLEVLPAELHRQRTWRAERVERAVARRARHLARGRE